MHWTAQKLVLYALFLHYLHDGSRKNIKNYYLHKISGEKKKPFYYSKSFRI